MLALVFGALGAQAASIPDFDKPVLIKTREQPVQRFITELFGRLDVPVVIAPEITGTVNGDFNGPVRSIFDKLSRTFFVTLYYDGSMAYVYPTNKSERNFIKMSPGIAQRVVANVKQLSLPNEHNTIRATDMGIVVSGAERFHSQVAELTKAINTKKPARTIDPPAQQGDTFRMFKLRYAWAHDVTMEVGGEQILVPGVASTLRTLISSTDGGAPTDVQRTSVGNSVPGLKGQGLGGNTDSDSTAGTAQKMFSNASGGTARIVADSLNNAVLIRDKPERMVAYEQLIESLDIEPKMVEIEATIIDMDTDRLRELGVNWRAQFEDGEAVSGNSAGTGLTSAGGVQPINSAAGGILSLVLGNKNRFISRIQALESQGAARIVSKPHVMTLSNVEALLDTSSTFFVRVNGQEEVDLFNVSVGTTLRVTPHVFDAASGTQIKLLVSIEDGSTSDRQVDDIPVIESSSINTQALVNVGESLLIGGLVRELNSNSVSKVPLLGSIPGLGALFRSNTKSSSRVERMFLISPRLNLRPGGSSPARLNVPYLSGTEGEILVSAPARLDLTQEALAARDDYHGVKQTLPAASPDVTLSPAGIKARVQRLDRTDRQPGSNPSQLPAPSVQDPALENPAFNVWQAITSNEIPPAPGAASAIQKNLPDRNVIPVDADGWQTISP